MSDVIESYKSNQKLDASQFSDIPSLHIIPPNKSKYKIQAVESTVCRICQTNTANEPLLSPCHCKGTLAYVHLTCLERWLNQSSRSYCELCMFRYNSVETKRYKLCQGLKLWVSHPRNKSRIRTDTVIVTLLTVVTVGLLSSSSVGLEYFVVEGSKLGFQKKWTKALICLFLLLIGAGYLLTIFLLVRDHFTPWYRWWINTVDIRLILPPSITSRITRKGRSIQNV